MAAVIFCVLLFTEQKRYSQWRKPKEIQFCFSSSFSALTLQRKEAAAVERKKQIELTRFRRKDGFCRFRTGLAEGLQVSEGFPQLLQQTMPLLYSG